jgi:D-cysteine desulfhydrase
MSSRCIHITICISLCNPGRDDVRLYGQFECRHGMTESHIITTTPLCNHGARKIRGVKGITVSTVVEFLRSSVNDCFGSTRSLRKQQRCSKMELITSLAFFLLTMVHPSPRQNPDYQSSIKSPREAEPYLPPVWASRDVLRHPPPHGRLHLANLPTPLYRFSPPPVAAAESTNDNDLLSSLSWYVKRDDCTSGLELGGNKIRKLEFLLADALAKDCNAVITIGGEQSNHCRATAAAARMVGLEPHLILRKSSSRPTTITGSTSSSTTAKDTEHTTTIQSDDLGLTGNLLVDRMVGSTIYTCTAGEYARFGSNELIARVDQHVSHSLLRRPYRIPVGGSNGLGSWGYIEAFHELLQQWQLLHQNDLCDDTDTSAGWSGPDHVVVACGSGGTAAGLAVGMALAYYYYAATSTKDAAAAANTTSTTPMVHAVGVCDDPDYFYRTIADIAQQMGLVVPESSTDNDSVDSIDRFLRRHLVVHQGKGRGYAQSSPEELDCVVQFAQRTGIMLDPVYTGKAWYNFLRWIETTSPASLQRPQNGQSILFWHTGGGLGLFEKCPDLEPMLCESSSDNVWTKCHRLDQYDKGYGIDISSGEHS